MMVLVMAATAGADTTGLDFRIDEGRNLNSFVRAGPVAAHLLLRSGTEPRILVAFPAGNSGVGLWFQTTGTATDWKLITPPRPLTRLDARKRPLHGIEFELETSAPELHVRGAVLSSVRVLRDYELQGAAPREVLAKPAVASGKVEWARDRLDGAPGYRLAFEALDGSRVSGEKFVAPAGRRLRMRVQALTGETPLRQLDYLLAPAAAADPRARDVLAFLSYREKFLAGSWRFNTYFGRDTLISALLLARVLEPPAIESAITSVLDRLAPNGEVAHEEDIGEFAVLRNLREGRGRVATPIYDYGMIDDDFLLAPLAARWLLDDARGRNRARAFLAEKGGGGEARGAALARNLVWVVGRASAFADDPRAANLVEIKRGRMTGNWRDSEQGLGGGRYAYDVNAALVPAALAATARLSAGGLLDPYLGREERQTLSRAAEMATVWTTHAPGLFTVVVPAARAREDITAYARQVGVDSERALRSLGAEPLAFNALSLDALGAPIPILHSDEGFRLLLTEPTPEEIAISIDSIMREYPAGLVTDAGMLVANPALANPRLRGEFSRYAYHGAVVWSWQQALLAAALDRQLGRTGLPERTRNRLRDARAELWRVIGRSNALRTSELWSWSYADGQFHIEPFGRPGADVDESNAAQLWSTVYLGLRPPKDLRSDTSPGKSIRVPRAGARATRRRRRPRRRRCASCSPLCRARWRDSCREPRTPSSR
jgi:hypothetical protein